jgi:colicin import membrane protein
VIDAAYKAILNDLSTSKNKEDQKIKEIVVSSYSVLSDPIQRAAYDQSIQKNSEVFQKEQYDVKQKIREDEKNTNNASDRVFDKKDNLSESIESKNLFIDKKPIFRKNILITFIAISSFAVTGTIGYLGYSKLSEKKPDTEIKGEQNKKDINSGIEVDAIKEIKNELTKEIKNNEFKVNNQNESNDSRVDSYNALKQAEIEKANLKQSRRERLLAQQEQIEFDDFSQQSESMRKIMQSDADNIAFIQKSIQDTDARMQENIRLNANYEQQEADKFASDEATRQSEIKNILVEQNQIDRDLFERKNRAIELEKQLTNLTNQGAILSKQAEIVAMHEKSISDIKNKINRIWSSMSNEIDSVFTGLNPQITAKFRCVIDVKLDYSGRVIDASVSKESSYTAFDDLAKNAVNSASPFSVPSDEAMFEKDFQSIIFVFSKNSVVLK